MSIKRLYFCSDCLDSNGGGGIQDEPELFEGEGLSPSRVQQYLANDDAKQGVSLVTAGRILLASLKLRRKRAGSTRY